MERAYFKYEILTMLRLSREEVEILSKACESHYDHAVKSLSTPGPGAILNAARNSLEPREDGKEYAEVGCTIRQLDTLAKAVEGVFKSPFISREGNQEFYDKFAKMMKEAGAEFRRLNTAHIEAMDASMKRLRDEEA